MAALVQPAGVIEPAPQRQQLYADLYQAYVRAYEGLQQSGTFGCLARLQQSGPAGF